MKKRRSKAFPLISVVVPAFNEEKYIGRTLKNLQSLDFPKDDYEIIIVDNASTDETSRVAEGFGVKVVLCKTRGVGAARQAGIAQASGNIVAFTDADTMVPSNWLTKISKHMEDERVIAVGGRVTPEGIGPILSLIFGLNDAFIRINCAFRRYPFWGNNLSVRKSAVAKIGGFNIDMQTSEDWDLCRRLGKHFGAGYKLVYDSGMAALTSNRKGKDPKVFWNYFLQGSASYISVVLLGKSKSAKIVSVR